MPTGKGDYILKTCDATGRRLAGDRFVSPGFRLLRGGLGLLGRPFLRQSRLPATRIPGGFRYATRRGGRDRDREPRAGTAGGVGGLVGEEMQVRRS